MYKVEFTGIAADKAGTQVTLFAEINELKSIHNLCRVLVKTVFQQFRNKYKQNIPTFIKSNMTWDFIVTCEDTGTVCLNSKKAKNNAGLKMRITPSIKKCKELSADEFKLYINETASLLANVCTIGVKFSVEVFESQE